MSKLDGSEQPGKRSSILTLKGAFVLLGPMVVVASQRQRRRSPPGHREP
jgi:hypothetical protein